MRFCFDGDEGCLLSTPRAEPDNPCAGTRPANTVATPPVFGDLRAPWTRAECFCRRPPLGSLKSLVSPELGHDLTVIDITGAPTCWFAVGES
jgi:hypothetical protein